MGRHSFKLKKNIIIHYICGPVGCHLPHRWCMVYSYIWCLRNTGFLNRLRNKFFHALDSCYGHLSLHHNITETDPACSEDDVLVSFNLLVRTFDNGLFSSDIWKTWQKRFHWSCRMVLDSNVQQLW